MTEHHEAFPAVADIDLDAIGENLRLVRSVAEKAILGVVKADAYGHGRAECARAMLNAGAEYLGVAQLAEALDLRQEVGPEPRILTWIYAPGAPLGDALRANLEISVGALWAIDELAAAARKTGITAKMHLKVDTGMARGGIDLWNLPEAAGKVRAGVAEGLFDVVGLWSHLARADEPECGLTEQQIDIFEEARRVVDKAGLDIRIHHLAASAGTLWHPKARYDMVRPGIALYGVSPNSDYRTAQQIGLRAAMTLSAQIIAERTVAEGTGISYGHTDRTDRPTHLGVVPLGYSDGIDRKASNVAPLVIDGTRTRIRGRVCMDQFVTELPYGVGVGERAWLFGDAESGLPTADEWAQATGTIGYEIVTRLGARVPRRYHGTGKASSRVPR
ncbi:MAG: alanine racemase [Ancrocorticia sp.]